MRILDEEKKFFLIIFISLFAWFSFLNEIYQSFFSGNTFFGYLIFISVYVYVVMEYIIGIRIDLEHFIAFLFVFLAFDIILYPILIPKAGPPNLTFDQSLSSDVFIYNLLPSNFPHMIRYYITYVIVPTFLLIAAMLIVGKRKFHSFVKQNV